jgi:eukaryotic-like serine/threonine-protein kinase
VALSTEFLATVAPTVRSPRNWSVGVSTPDDIVTEPGIVPGLQLVEPETGPAEGIESRVMLQRARARLLGRQEQAPARVGRYVVVERVGAGAMGVVLRAYDPKLRREVALKIVRPRASIDGEEAQARLLREAQALARLNHPNVVAVYDAESSDDGVCIAMEYVEGRTLRQWLREQQRSLADVLPMIIAVARGLAAAHAAGLVHRDVKPDNCLVGADGRLRVTDFGLARATEGVTPSLSDSLHGLGDDEDEPLTQIGTVLGTPAYMAPEQHAGSTADELTDQYALGVLMWEAFHGERPFRGPKMEALAEAKHRGPPDRPSSRVPGWLHAVIVRAMAVEPGARWPSVVDLADALESGQAKVRRRRTRLAVAGLAVTMASVVGWQQLERHRSRTACEDEAASIHRDVWNEAMRERVHEGLQAADASHAAQTHERLVEWIDPHVAAWEAAWSSACVAARVEGRLSPELHARARQCLDEHRDGLVAFFDVLAEGKGTVAQTAVTTASELPEVASCADRVALERRRATDETTADLRRDLHRVRALVTAQRFEEAFASANEVRDAATLGGHEELELEASVLAGMVAGHLERHEESETTLRRVLVDAGAAGLDEVAAEAALGLVSTVGLALERHPAALAHADTATLLVERIEPEGTGPAHVKLLSLRAMVQLEKGDAEEAEHLQQRALEVAEATYGPEHPNVATQLQRLASIVRDRGSLDEARPLYARALRISETALGEHHPAVEALRETVR